MGIKRWKNTTFAALLTLTLSGDVQPSQMLSEVHDRVTNNSVTTISIPSRGGPRSIQIVPEGEPIDPDKCFYEIKVRTPEYGETISGSELLGDSEVYWGINFVIDPYGKTVTIVGKDGVVTDEGVLVGKIITDLGHVGITVTDYMEQAWRCDVEGLQPGVYTVDGFEGIGVDADPFPIQVGTTEQ